MKKSIIGYLVLIEQLEDEVAGEDSESSIAIGQSNGDHDLARTVLQIQINDQRFEDAEEMEQDTDGARHCIFELGNL